MIVVECTTPVRFAKTLPGRYNSLRQRPLESIQHPTSERWAPLHSYLLVCVEERDVTHFSYWCLDVLHVSISFDILAQECAVPTTAEGKESVMQEQEMEKKPLKLDPLTIRKVYFLFWRALSHPEAQEQLLQLLQSTGVSEKNTAFIIEQYFAMKAVRDDEAWFRIDRYLVGGIGVIDLILLQIILPMSALDAPLQAALLALVVSLPLAAGALFFSFLTEKDQMTPYKRIHTWLSELSLLTGAVALTALIWHNSPLGGKVFLCLAIAIYSLCYLYAKKFIYKKHSAYGIFTLLLKIPVLLRNTQTSSNAKEENRQ